MIFNAFAQNETCPAPDPLEQIRREIRPFSEVAHQFESGALAQNLSNQFNRVGIECPERMWPNYNLRNTQIIMVNHQTHQAWSWNRQNRGAAAILEELSYDQLDPSVRSIRSYGFPTAGSPVTVISLDRFDRSSNRDQCLIFAVHESFHHFLQHNGVSPWQLLNSDRNTTFPSESHPRYFRRQLYRSLVAAYRAPRGEIRNRHLRTAAYWQRRYLSSGRDIDHTLRTDIVEGTAQYYEEVAQAVAHLGCQASEQDIHGYILDHIDRNLRGNAESLRGDMEGCSLGAMAGLLLREQNNATRQNQVARGESPIQTLLAGLTPLSQRDDRVLRRRLDSQISSRNRELEPIINPVLAHINSRDYVRLELPSEMLVGGFSGDGWFTAPQAPGVTITRSFTGRFHSQSSDLQVEGQHTYVPAQDNPCLQERRSTTAVVLIPRHVLQDAQGSQFQFHGDEIQGNASFRRVTDSRGRLWLCVE